MVHEAVELADLLRVRVGVRARARARVGVGLGLGLGLGLTTAIFMKPPGSWGEAERRSTSSIRVLSHVMTWLA